jgi:hypothetical protein
MGVLEVGGEPDSFPPNSLTLKMPGAVLAEMLENLHRCVLSSTPVVTLFARTEAHTSQVGNRSSCTVVYSQT